MARQHLIRVEPRLVKIVSRVGECTLAPRTDYFAALCGSIVAQQLSTRVAAVIFKRFKRLFPRSRPTPVRLKAIDDATLRGAGLSRAKISYLKSLADAFVERRIPTRRFRYMDDEQIIQSLIPLRGIGRWTAEMFLIFVLNRPDVLPVDDLGLRKGVRQLYGLRRLPDAAVIRKRTACWRPYRSIGTWYVWRADGEMN